MSSLTDYCYRESSPSDMVYTQARLDEALSAFRECKKFLERRGLKTANLESHLGRKYELRKPPPETAFAPRPTLWALRDDDSDGEFDPSNGRKKKKNTASESRPARLHKRKLSISGDDSVSSGNKRCKPKGTTWAQGRRLGRSLKVTFKFTKTENLQVLKDLFALNGPGAEKMPNEEHVNVFNANSLDSGFNSISPSDLKGDTRGISERPAGTIVDPSVGLATPRGSIGSLEALQANTQNPFTDVPAFAEEPTRDLRNRVVPVKLGSPSKKRYTCLTCKEEGSKCSLLKTHPDFLGPCDACELADSPCRINEDDEPRMGPLTRMDVERENKKRSAEEDGGTGSKRRRSENGNIGSIFDYNEDSSSGLGNSMLKKKDKSKDNLMPINGLNRSGKVGFSGRDFGSNVHPLDIGHANSKYDSSKSPDSGYHSSVFASSPPKYSDINMGNTLDTAISVSDSSSPPTSPFPFTFTRDASTTPSFEPDPTDSITTSWAHPVNFQHQPKQTGLPCHFCEDFRYGFLGLGPAKVEVAWDQDAKNYIEISNGHFGEGHEMTRMCAACSLERLRIRFCGHSHDAKGKGKEGEGQDKSIHRHQLIEVPSWRAGARANKQKWTEQLGMKKTEAEYCTQPTLPPCHLCFIPATYRCDTVQMRNRALQPLEGEEVGRHTCGLRVCENCKRNVEGAGGEWVADKVLGVYERADAEFLFPGGLLERAWGEYLESVGLLQ